MPAVASANRCVLVWLPSGLWLSPQAGPAPRLCPAPPRPRLLRCLRRRWPAGPYSQLSPGLPRSNQDVMPHGGTSPVRRREPRTSFLGQRSLESSMPFPIGPSCSPGQAPGAHSRGQHLVSERWKMCILSSTHGTRLINHKGRVSFFPKSFNTF